MPCPSIQYSVLHNEFRARPLSRRETDQTNRATDRPTAEVRPLVRCADRPTEGSANGAAAHGQPSTWPVSRPSPLFQPIDYPASTVGPFPGADGSMCLVLKSTKCHWAHKVAASISKICNLVMNSVSYVCDIMSLNKLLLL